MAHRPLPGIQPELVGAGVQRWSAGAGALRDPAGIACASCTTQLGLVVPDRLSSAASTSFDGATQSSQRRAAMPTRRMRIEGPLVSSEGGRRRQRLMLRLWEIKVVLAGFSVTTASPAKGAGLAAAAHRQRANERCVVRDNIRHRRDIGTPCLEAINAARDADRAYQRPFPARFRFRHALMAAAERGVRRSVLLNRIDRLRDLQLRRRSRMRC